MSDHTRSSTTSQVTQAFRLPKVAVSQGRLWLFVIFCSLVVMGLGWWAHNETRESLRGVLATGLRAILKADVAALDQWMAEKKRQVLTWADRPQVRQNTQELVNISTGSATPGTRLLNSQAQKNLRDDLQSFVQNENVGGYVIVDKNGFVLASDNAEVVGVRLAPGELSGLDDVFRGKQRVMPPFREGTLARAYDAWPSLPLMAVMAPIRGGSTSLVGTLLNSEQNQRVIAAMVFLIDARTDFSNILAVAHMGETGNTYAFGRDGLMLSESRFSGDLKRLGLIGGVSNDTEILSVYVRDPGGDLTAGFKPSGPLSKCPLTHMALAATQGLSGEDTVGYRDYRGVTVVGAWEWLDAYNIGIATEVTLAEAQGVLRPIWLTFGLLIFLLVAAGALVLAKTLVNARLRERVDEARQLGQYTLIEKIGEGGMGEVYRAQHAMLRRPVAVKLLKDPTLGPEAVARFEQEVQQTCQLSHPNTIEIYDFGRTPDGVFYYVMEFLEGLTLSRLVSVDGAVPVERVVYILKQVCGSLEEAHDLGLIHRDIKAENIVLCERGGLYDVAKVLDFGLAKDVIAHDEIQVTSAHMLAGTPRYIAPERMRDARLASPRTDLFSVGAVAFLMLTGRDAFLGASVMEICEQVLHAPASRPSECTDRPIPKILDDLVLSCLSRDPDERPLNARAMIDVLDTITGLPEWGSNQARDWWFKNARRVKSVRARTGAVQAATSATRLSHLDDAHNEPGDPTH